MDAAMIVNFQANKYKKHPILNNVFLYSLTALVCTLFCSSPLWFSSLCSSTKAYLFVSLPKLGSLFFSSKILFIVGNLIVIVLVRESKIRALDSSPASDVYYNKHVNRSQRPQNFSASKFTETVRACKDGEDKEREGWTEKRVEQEREKSYGQEELTLPVEEINKRADAFIARVNRQRRLEAAELY